MKNLKPLTIHKATDLDREAVHDLAHRRLSVILGAPMLAFLLERRREMLSALATSGAIYGVSTGAGAQSDIKLSGAEQERHQNSLLLARAVGGPPWLDRIETRALLAVRLRTFLDGDACVSIDLCQRLVAFLNADLLPAVPRNHSGSAGEIIPLAHAFGPLIGVGNFLKPVPGLARAITSSDTTSPSADALSRSGFRPLNLGAKEGIALLEGVPGTTALALLHAEQARDLIQQMIVAAAAEISLLHLNRDPYHALTARGDNTLALILRKLRYLAGPESSPSALQAPVSFRIVGPVLAYVERSTRALERAVDRALVGVTDSPAFLDGHFVGTAGFHGVDLAGSLSTLSAAVVHAAEVSAARLHRMLDPKVSGLTHQLAKTPGPDTGLVVVHKRAVATIHHLRSAMLPTIVGSIETSAGQEDIQSFSWQAAQSTREALAGAREVLACELLAIHQVLGLAKANSKAGTSLLLEPLRGPMSAISAVVPSELRDRPFGTDIQSILTLLNSRWPR